MKKRKPQEVVPTVLAIATQAAEKTSVNRLAVDSGVPQSTLSDWIAGRRQNMSLENFGKLCRFLGITL